jgi:hypothetical protein
MQRNGYGAGCLVVLVVGVMPLVLLVGVLLAAHTADTLAKELRAARAEGVKGVFTAEELRCEGRGPCRWHGSFLPEHGRSARQNVWIYGYGSSGLSEGDRVPALDAGYGVKVYRPGSYDWEAVALLMAATLVTLLGPAYALWRVLWKRRFTPSG